MRPEPASAGRHPNHRTSAAPSGAGLSGRPAAGPFADNDQPEAVLTERSARIVNAHKLLRRSRRDQAGEFLAEGAQAVREAIAAERDHPGLVIELYVTETGASRNVELVRAAFAAGIEVSQVTDKAAESLSDTVHPQGVVARCRSVFSECATLLASAPRLLAVLVETNDPGNAGTIIRLADAAGADGVIFAGEAVDPHNPKAVRASTGSLFHLPIVQVSDPVALATQLSASGLTVLASTGTGDIDLDAFGDAGLLAEPTAWLFGSEAHGLPEEVLAAADERLAVPIHGRAESLNLATAAAVCLYASARAQRAAQ